MHDLIIVGAGPAGATVARSLPAGVQALLLDRRRPSQGGGKLCGGLIAPDAQRMLAATGIGLPRDVLVDPQVFVVRSVDRQSGAERYYQRHYLNVDRRRLDSYLTSLVPPQVGIRDAVTVTSVLDCGEFVEVSGTGPEGAFTERCRVLVGADGAGSLVRRRVVDDGSSPAARYVAIQDTYRVQAPPSHFTVLFDEKTTDFYSWAIPKDGTLLIGSALRPGADARERHGRCIEAMRDLGYVLGEHLGSASALLERPRRRSDISFGIGRVMLVGEAAGLVSPSSAEGLSYALASGAAAAEAVLEGANAAAAYERYAAHLCRKLLLKWSKSAAIYTPWIRRLLMHAGVGSTRVRVKT